MERTYLCIGRFLIRANRFQEVFGILRVPRQYSVNFVVRLLMYQHINEQLIELQKKPFWRGWSLVHIIQSRGIKELQDFVKEDMAFRAQKC